MGWSRDLRSPWGSHSPPRLACPKPHPCIWSVQGFRGWLQELWGQPCLHKAVLGFESMSFIPGNPALRQGRGLQEFAALGMRAARCGMLDLGCRARSEVLAGSPGSGAEQTSAGATGVWEDLSTRGFRCHLPLPARGVTALPPLRLQNKSSDKVSLLPPSPHPRSPTWA